MPVAVVQWPAAWLVPLLLLLVQGVSLLFLQLPTTCVVALNTFAPTLATTPAPVTAPVEAESFKAIFQKWGITSKITWTNKEDPCSDVALDDSIVIDDVNYNPFIKCDCSDNNGSTCHITALKAQFLDNVGEIPNELWNLTFLTKLNLIQTYLKGSLSPSVGNLKKLEGLLLGETTLTGNLPKELGQLTALKILDIGTTNFSGTLPSEIGNLRFLQTLYMDSCGVSGEIPSSFANLVNLQQLWASNNELNGSIPDFIGTWSQLSDLRLEGNSFIGSLPSSFGNLTTLKTLRIVGLTNGSSSLAFIANLTSLTTLSLRNINFSDTIPTGIGGLTNLTYLDLSFNNIRGQIPDQLFSLGSLTNLFLGNNKLTGSIPQRKSSSLTVIDVSYNDLSGSLPSWVNDQYLQLNFVANNFTLPDNSALPLGLYCLQKNFPCHRGSAIYTSFAINCGGPQIKSSDGTVYEGEYESLGPATYYVNADRWAVSNAGSFIDDKNAAFTTSFSSPINNTLDPGIFQTARLSPGSLRYYGLGLENGNYTVILQFAELVIPNGNTWTSFGRRVFDIYIQGNLAWKNFDIHKEAGGQSFSAITKKFTAQITTNHLEIHLLWLGKGTIYSMPKDAYGPSISAISVTPNFIRSLTNEPIVPNEPHPGKDKIGLVLAIVLPLGCLCLLFLVSCYVILKDKSLHAARDEELQGVEPKLYIFSYSELKSATEDFNSSRKLGEGGFGPVYKGNLGDGRAVAVKQLSFKSHQGKSQFVAEIATISAVQHRNLVNLYGCCIKGKKHLLVYEFLENGSLDRALFGNVNLKLNWAKRFEICMGVARGLTYLHQESRLRIVHRDVKASNILLDSELNPKISDFGLARLYDEKQTHISTVVAGTLGYLAPEYAMRGHFSEKVDVFSFGVLALEIVSGRSNSDTTLSKENVYLLEWAWQQYESEQEVELVDEKLTEFDEEEVKRVIRVALLCTQFSPRQRPSMSRVVAMLSGDVEVGAMPAKPEYLTDLKYEDASNQSNNIPTSAVSSTNILLDSFISVEEGR